MATEAPPRHRVRPVRRAPPRAGAVAAVVVLCLGAVACIMPFLYMLSTSLKTVGETITRVSPIPFNPDFWPSVPRWVNYATAWNQASFSLYFRNSVITACLTVAGVMLSSSLAAYAFAKIRFAGSRLLFSVFLATLIIPESVYLIPNFRPRLI